MVGQRGPAGGQGMQGTPGSAGTTGPWGAQGFPGAPGAQGGAGPVGVTGSNGAAGQPAAPGGAGISKGGSGRSFSWPRGGFSRGKSGKGRSGKGRSGGKSGKGRSASEGRSSSKGGSPSKTRSSSRRKRGGNQRGDSSASASSQKAVWKGEFYKWPKAISKLSDCDVSGKKPTKVVESREVDYNDHSFAKLGFNDRFVAKWTGSVVVKKAGSYTFKTCSDDGSNLFVGSRRVVNNDGLHGTECKEGSMELAAGAHAITVNFFENGGGASCKVLWRGPDVGGSFVKMHVVSE